MKPRDTNRMPVNVEAVSHPGSGNVTLNIHEA